MNCVHLRVLLLVHLGVQNAIALADAVAEQVVELLQERNRTLAEHSHVEVRVVHRGVLAVRAPLLAVEAFPHKEDHVGHVEQLRVLVRHLKARVRQETHLGALLAPRIRRADRHVERHHLVVRRVEHEHGRNRHKLAEAAERQLVEDVDHVAVLQEARTAAKHAVIKDLLLASRPEVLVHAVLRSLPQQITATVGERLLHPAQLRVARDQTTETRERKARATRVVNVAEPLIHVGDRTAHRPADDVQLTRVLVLEARCPAGRKRTARVAVTGHLGTLLEADLVKVERRADRIQHRMALKTPRSKRILGALVVRHGHHPALVEQSGDEQRLVRGGQVIQDTSTRAQRVAWGTARRERVLVQVRGHELVVVVIVGHDHGRDRVARIVPCHTVRTVEQLVGRHTVLGDTRVRHGHFTGLEDRAGLLVFPAVVGRVERVVIGSCQRARSEAVSHTHARKRSLKERQGHDRDQN